MKYMLPFSLLMIVHFFQINAQLIQSPFFGSAIQLPGKIEAENYDQGGQGIAYYDTDVSNKENSYRPLDAVDLEVCAEGGYNIAYMATGEWLEYTINVMGTASYKIELRTASAEAGGALRLDMDGVAVSSVLPIHNTGGWQTWTTITVPAVRLSAGEHILRVWVVQGGFNLNSLDVSNTAPVVAIIAPSSGTMFTAPASFSINANATDMDGTVSKVDFYNGSTLLGTSTSSPYSFFWSNVQEGTYTVTAKATDNAGGISVSAPATITVITTVIPNQPPSVTLTSPVHNSTANAPASIAMSADATDSDGTINRVEFYNGSVLLGSDKSAPYTYVWTGVSAGVYAITSKAFDDKGASKTSATAVITILAVITDACAGLPSYVENGGYAAGNKVKNGNGRYECRSWPYSGWCNGSSWAYAPGDGAYWSDAWNLLGTCGNSRLTEEVKNREPELTVTASPNPFQFRTNLAVVLRESGELSIRLYDKDGVLIRVLSEGFRMAGSYDFVLSLPSEKAGFYYIKCITPNGSLVSQMVKMER